MGNKNKATIYGENGSRLETMYAELPSNSNLSKAEQVEVERPATKKVVKGTVTKVEKSLFKKFKETFTGDDTNSIIGYLVVDILIPSAKDLIYDMVKSGVEMMLFSSDDRPSDRAKRKNGTPYISYTSYSNQTRRNGTKDRPTTSRKSVHDFSDIALDSRGEAEDVIKNLVDLIDQYDEATVADLYGLVGIESDYTDDNWGWDNLSRASVSRYRDKFILNLPKPKSLR